jgi:hypothetical protein
VVYFRLRVDSRPGGAPSGAFGEGHSDDELGSFVPRI